MNYEIKNKKVPDFGSKNKNRLLASILFLSFSASQQLAQAGGFIAVDPIAGAPGTVATPGTVEISRVASLPTVTPVRPLTPAAAPFNLFGIFQGIKFPGIVIPNKQPVKPPVNKIPTKKPPGRTGTVTSMPIPQPTTTRPPNSKIGLPISIPSIIPPHKTLPILKGKVAAGLYLQSESIKVDINNQVAKTYITQTFYNPTDRNLAGTYLFPLPEDTTFSSFSLHIDGKPVEGKILEANEARQQYEEIVRRMVDPGLLEYADYKTVRARIFPIPAHGTKKVELEYTQVLKANNGLLKYRFPLKTEGQSTAIDEVKVDIKINSAQQIRTIWSPSHTVEAKRPDPRHALISYQAKETAPDKDLLLYYSISDSELTANLLTHKNKDEDGYFLLTLTPPLETKTAQTKDVVLITDTSGSMAGEKMKQNLAALRHVVKALNTGDRFNIVSFNTDTEKFKPALVLADDQNKKAALEYIDGLEPHGGTNIGDALRSGLALLDQPSDKPAYLVMLTDGQPTVGLTNINELIKTVNPKRDIRLFDFGIGYDVNTKLLNKLAEGHHGTSQYVEPDEDLETAVSNLYSKIKAPVLSDVSISYSGIEAKNTYPKEVKDLFAGSQVVLLGRYKAGGKSNITLSGKINGQNKSFTFPVNFASEETDNGYLQRLWAMRRIGYLSEIAEENGNNREVVDEIVTLSKKYGIITAYTSFLVTDPNEGRPVPPSPTPVPMTAGSNLAMNEPAAMGGRRRHGSSGGAGGSITIVPSSRSNMVAFDNLRQQARDGKNDAAAPLAKAGWYGAPRETQIADYRSDRASVAQPSILASKDESGREAVKKAKMLNAYKQSLATDNDDKSGMRQVNDKTFVFNNGFWMDTTFTPEKYSKPTVITFGTKEYFDLVKANPSLSKYLAIGKQVIIIFNGTCYKVVAPQAG